MKGMTLGKSLLLSGFLLFSVLVTGQSLWACETPDESDFQCDEKLDIKRVRLDFENDVIYISGKNFTNNSNGSAPDVTLRVLGLDVLSYNDRQIVARFPAWRQANTNCAFLQATIINAKINIP